MSWRLLPVTNRPPPRYGHTLAFDAARKRIVLFGGWDGSTYLADTWEWDGTGWTGPAPALSPPARAAGAGIWDPARRRLVAFGGAGPIQGSFLSDVWEYVGTPCRIAGPGHAGGGLTITCTSAPRVGTSFGVTFSDPPPAGLGFHLLLMGPGRGSSPPAVLDPPAVCARAFLHAVPLVVLSGTGDPVLFTLPVPGIRELAGMDWCLQGASLERGGRFRATDGRLVTIVP